MEYNKLYIKELLLALDEEFRDLDRWSVENDDVVNEEVDKMKELLNKVKEIVKN